MLLAVKAVKRDWLSTVTSKRQLNTHFATCCRHFGFFQRKKGKNTFLFKIDMTTCYDVISRNHSK